MSEIEDMIEYRDAHECWGLSDDAIMARMVDDALAAEERTMRKKKKRK